MLKIEYTRRMKQDAKRMSKRGKDMSKLANMLDLLAAQKLVPSQFHDHALTGNWKDFRACHIEPDWLLIYRISGDRLILIASATGTHAELFNL